MFKKELHCHGYFEYTFKKICEINPAKKTDPHPPMNKTQKNCIVLFAVVAVPSG